MSDGDKPHSFTEKAVGPIGILEVANRILTPLLGGLENSRMNEDGAVGSMFKGLHTQLPLGNSRHTQMSFSSQEMRRAEIGKIDPDEGLFPVYTSSPYTEALSTLHDQVVDVGKNMGLIFDPLKVVPGHGSISDRVITDKEAVAEALTPEKLPKITVAFYKRNAKCEAVGEPLLVTQVDNVIIGPKKKSLAHLLVAFELAGDAVVRRNRKVGDFMWDATGGFVSTLPPLQEAIYRHLDQQLQQQNAPAHEVLSQSGCNLNQAEVRKAFDQLLPYAQIYELGCNLRGAEKRDYVQKAFANMEKYCSRDARDLRCEDGYQAGQLLEGMINHAILRANPKEREPLEHLKTSFMVKARTLLHDAGGISVSRPDFMNRPTASVENVMAIPEADKIVEAFADCYAADILLDKKDALTEKAWNARVQLQRKSGNTPDKPAF